jgi:glycosyltransferase involved in cell wall biosynthesis
MSLGRVAMFGWSDSVHVQRWAKGLSGRGYDIRVISSGCSPISGIDTVILPRVNRWSYFTQVRRAVAAAREFHPDLIHVHYAGGFGLWGASCRFAPLLVSVWGSDVALLQSHSIRRLVTRWILRRASHVTATSVVLGQAALELAGDIADRFSVLPFGVAVPESPAPMPPPPVRLCFIKQHRARYGPDILLRALALATRKIPDLHLTMAGVGEMTENLRQLTRDLNLTQHVDFVGMVDNRSIYSLLEEHHIMVMPSFEEAFGVAALEAGACARPVIASRVGGIPEVVQDGVTGILVPPGDVSALSAAIVTLAGDLDRSTTMGCAGHQFVSKTYSWERSLDLMSALYQQVINETSQNSSV